MTSTTATSDASGHWLDSRSMIPVRLLAPSRMTAAYRVGRMLYHDSWLAEPFVRPPVGSACQHFVRVSRRGRDGGATLVQAPLMSPPNTLATLDAV